MATYTVKSGDTLSGIAKNFGVNWQTDITGFKSGNPNLIYPGEVLTVNTPNSSAPAPAAAPVAKIAPVPAVTTPVTQVATTPQSTITKPSSPDQVTTYLDQIQGSIKHYQDQINAPQKSDKEIMADIKSQIEPSVPKPEAPNLVELFKDLSEGYEVKKLENAVSEYDNLIETEEQNLLASRFDEEGKLVPMNVISGRVSEQEKNAMLRIDFWGRQKNRAVTQLNSAYNVINTIVNLTNTDFQNAQQQYKDEIEKNISIYNLFTEAKETQEAKKEKAYENLTNTATNLIGIAQKERDFQLELYKVEQAEVERERNFATANLQIYSNLITKGNMKYGDLDTNTKLEITKMETISGLGIGFMSKITADNANGEMLSTTTRQDASGMKYADTIFRMPDGSIKVVSTQLGKELLPEYAGGNGGSMSQTTKTKYVDQALDVLLEEDVSGRLAEIGTRDMPDYVRQQEIDKIKSQGDDKLLSYEEFEKARRRIIGLVGDEAEADKILDQAWEAGGYSRWNW